MKVIISIMLFYACFLLQAQEKSLSFSPFIHLFSYGNSLIMSNESLTPSSSMAYGTNAIFNYKAEKIIIRSGIGFTRTPINFVYRITKESLDNGFWGISADVTYYRYHFSRPENAFDIYFGFSYLYSINEKNNQRFTFDLNTKYYIPFKDYTVLDSLSIIHVHEEYDDNLNYSFTSDTSYSSGAISAENKVKAKWFVCPGFTYSRNISDNLRFRMSLSYSILPGGFFSFESYGIKPRFNISTGLEFVFGAKK